MKKLFIIGGIIIAIFILIVVLTNKSNETKLKDNPYGTDKLDKSTINLIGNKDYNNIVLPDDLEKKVKSGDPVTTYFFHPECQYCMAMTPVLMPIADEVGVDVLQFNILEFQQEMQAYNIQSWPVLIHFKDGEEVGRTTGQQPEENIRAFFKEFEGKE